MQKQTKKWLLSLVLVLLLGTLAACAGSTAYTDSQNIVEASALADLMAQEGVVVVDARAAEEFNKGHLKGAVNLSPDELNGQGTVAGMLGTPQQFNRVMSKSGISPESTVIVYDGNDGIFASRLWWAMKVFGHENVKVVNGGASAIVNAGLEISGDATQVNSASYNAKAQDSSLIATIDDVKDAVANGTATIIDVRTPAEFDEGAIPTAILYEHTQNLYSDGTFKSARDIYLNYKDLGLEKDAPILLYCKSSVRATQTMLLLKEAGYSNVKVYDGAWLEWSVSGEETTSPAGPVEATVQDAS